MSVLQLVPLERAQDAEVVRQDRINLRVITRTSPVTAMRPYMNLRNHYYPDSQAATIAPTNPPVKKMVTPELLAAIGAASSYRVPDEMLRQYSLGVWLQQNAANYYKTAHQ